MSFFSTYFFVTYQHSSEYGIGAGRGLQETTDGVFDATEFERHIYKSTPHIKNICVLSFKKVSKRQYQRLAGQVSLQKECVQPKLGGFN